MINKKNFIVPPEIITTCEKCDQKFKAGRYVNHCPFCLFSKHVDDQIPGDRQSKCQALMEPIAAFRQKGKWRIQHKCQKCQKITVVDTNEKDSEDQIEFLSHFPTLNS